MRRSSTFHGLLFATVLILAVATLPASAGEEARLEGTWAGSLDAGGVTLRLAFNVEVAEDGAVSCTMDSLDQGAMGIPVDGVSLSGQDVGLKISAIGGSYSGTLSDDGTRIEGTWSQGGARLSLDLARKDGPVTLQRPQEPSGAMPYRAIDVRAETGGHALAGTLTLPEGSGPHPAVVLISGSGPQDRDETIFGHRPFLVLADHLTRRGIAVLRYDDRGVGESTGSRETATSRDFAEDTSAMVALLRGRDEIDSQRIGLIGHSEGGLIAPMVANESGGIAFVVLLAGPAVPGSEILEVQGFLQTRAATSDTLLAEMNAAIQARLFEIVRETPEDDAATRKIDRFLRDAIGGMSDVQKQAIGDVDTFVANQAAQLVSPWFRFFLEHDPRPDLRELSCPVLALNGELDLQVAPDQNLPEMAAALAAGATNDYTVVQLPELNHLFQTASSGTLAEYATLEETFAPLALSTISNWVLQRVGG